MARTRAWGVRVRKNTLVSTSERGTARERVLSMVYSTDASTPAIFSAPAMGQLGRGLDGGRQIRDEASTKVLGRCCPRCLLPSCVGG
jgi:hypothetical protein